MTLIAGVDSRWLYTALVALIVLERLGELFLARRNRRRLLARGAIEAGESHYPWMVLLHTALLVACLAEVWGLRRPPVPLLAGISLAVLAGTMALRYWAITTLGDRWTTRILVLPGEPVVHGGPYRWLRHPNYVAVVLEVAALPLVHTAWWSAIVFSVANVFLLRLRIRKEEEALAASSDYLQQLGDRPSFLPGARRRREVA
jgi:methyltransferase